METIYVNSKATGKIPQRIWDYIFCVMAIIGFSAELQPFQNGYIGVAVSAACGIICVGLCVILNRGGIVKFIPFILIMLATVVMFSSFSRGMLKFINDIITAWNIRFETQLPLLAAQTSVTDSCIFFALFVSAVGIIMQYLISIKRGYIVCVILFTVLEIVSMLRIHIDISASAYIGICIFSIWVYSSNTNGVYLKNIFLAAWPIMAIVICFSILFMSFRGSEAIEASKQNIAAAMHDIRYGDDTLPDGDMRKAYSMVGSDKETLLITSEHEREEYLAGFIGSSFNGIEWSRHSSELFLNDWNGIFRWMSANSFEAQTQYSNHEHLQNDEHSDMETTVENVGADRSYIYVPYSLSEITEGEYKIKDDLAVKSKGIFGADKYKFTYTAHDTIENTLIEESTNGYNQTDRSETAKAQRVYSGFVEDAYMDIDDDVRQLMNDVFFSGDSYEEYDDNMSLYSVITRIRSIMELRVEYSDTPSRYYGNKEFSEWFLNDAKSGNSAYFATVGALALRAAGYASRYVEGYHKNTISGTTSITEENSHAWIEVYIENAGWVPVEVTPGFYSTNRLNQMTVEISKDIAGNGSDENSQYNASEPYNDDVIADEEETVSEGIDIMYIVVWLIIIVMAAIFAVVIRRPIVIAICKYRMNNGEFELQIYGYIFRIFKASGIKCDRTSPYDCAEAVCERFKIRTEEYSAMVSLMQKYTFGQQELKQSEKRTLLLFAKKLRRLLYNKCGKLKKIKYLFFDCV
jgi:transglutaminase-like putative cysteine protease